MNSTQSKPPRQCKPLLPVQVEGQFIDGQPASLRDGVAVLEIREPDAITLYWTQLLTVDGHGVGCRLTKFLAHCDGNEPNVYDVNLIDGTCDCPDGIYRPERPGGCRHLVALRQALPLLVQEVA